MLLVYILFNCALFIDNCKGSVSQPIYTRDLYTASTLDCPCVHLKFVLRWLHNDSEIHPRQGKYILSGDHIEILDIRYSDSGVYTCIGPHVNCSFLLQVHFDHHSMKIHEQTIPLNFSDEIPDTVYWHPKMKRENSMLYYDYEPINATVYFYTSANQKPVVQWLRPEEAFSDKGVSHEPELLNCTEMVETQRPLKGSCYRASFTIYTLSMTQELACEVALNHSNRISTSFVVMRNARDRFPYAPNVPAEVLDADSIDPDLGFVISDDQILDELKIPVQTTSTIPSITATTGQTTSENIPHHPVQPALDIFSSKRSRLDQFKFTTLSPTHCRGSNVTLRCHLPFAMARLELWYLGPRLSMTTRHPSDEACLDNGSCYSGIPFLLKVSRNESYHFRSRTGQLTTQYSFSNTLSFTLTNLMEQHSGTYMCRFGTWYKPLDITVTRCGVEKDYLPLVLLLAALTISSFTLLLPILVCIRSRQKPIIAVISKPIPSGMHGWLKSGKNKKLQIFSHSNPIYSQQLRATWDMEPLLSSSGLAPSTEQPEEPCRKQNSISFPLFPYQFKADKKWEIERSRVHIESILDEGNFGAVYRGTLSCGHGQPSGDPVGVAIKTLRRDFNEQQFVDLIRELEVLKILTGHPHVIRLLGACTQNGWPLIIEEFALHGNMRDFLRRHRPPHEDVPNADSVFNFTSALEMSDSIKLDQHTLLRFACHVLKALMHLESFKLVHRDIAARNVLLTRDYVAKLGDFGFTCPADRQTDENIRELLPFKWMAPECFQSNCFSHKSDVWSFGIFLWELFTLGNTPYPGLSTSELQHRLDAGHRNLRPTMAPLALYDLMLLCWSDQPCRRPDFNQLYDAIENIRSDCSTLSTDTGFHSDNWSRQTSRTDSSLASPKWKPPPPTRTCSLPGHHTLPKGYVEMHCHEYLQPKSAWQMTHQPSV